MFLADFCTAKVLNDIQQTASIDQR